MTRYYEDVELGDEIGPLEKIATDQSVSDFCDVWGNTGPSRFTDNESAQAEGLSGAIVPGIMSMSYMAQLLTQWTEGGSIKKLDVVFRQLVSHNSPLRLIGVVTDMNQVDGENQVECDLYLQNEQGDRMVGGQAILLLAIKG
ncbi:MAG: MaoC family dehydratase [Chloroflexota bacterium]|nr:MaoC family dehydratase [Chloroflexota bacterium]